MDILIWAGALVAILGAGTALYLSSRHQRLLRDTPAPRVLRRIALACIVIGYAALCQVVTTTTAFFILILFGMVFCTFLPLLLASLMPAKEGVR